MLKMTAANAAKRLPGHPYSILENLWHAVFWQTIWLDRIEGKKAKSFMEDWQSPPVSEFPKLRAAFLANLDKARKLCAAKTFKHKMDSDEKAIKTLIAMAIHDSYHIGQMNVMKRAMRKAKE
jgi:uncharacterized damage-inducible protein DinB